MSLKDPVVQKRIFAVLLAGLVAYFFFGTTLFPFCYRVQKTEIERLEQQLKEKERKVMLARSKAGRMEVLQAQLVELEEDWRLLERLLPFTEDIPGFLYELGRLATQSEVAIDLLHPGQMRPGDGYSMRSIEMRVVGDYHKVGAFLSRVANASRVIRTEGLALRSLTETSSRKNVEGGVKRGTIEATFKATLFMLEGNHAGI
jgi:type IV pilus assembly protein PilO